MTSSKNNKPLISVVVPVYQEEPSIRPFLQRIEPILEAIGPYEIIFCADPSPDQTEKVIEEEIERNSHISMLVFSRRFGQPAATMAGILNCNGEMCVVIDVDLQDPPAVISDLYQKLKEGYEVVFATRRTRKGETLVKRFISYWGYKIIHSISEVKIPKNAGDFRIISRRVIEELRKLKESHGFLRGLVALVGFKQSHVEYDREERSHGEGKYNRYLGSLKIGFNGLVGFSNFLLGLSFLVGLALATGSFFIILFMVITKLLLNYPYPLGTPTIITLILLMGSVQLISIGILGEYIGRIYDEVKGRPQYVIDKKVNLEDFSPAEEKIEIVA